jgi:DNA repair photolyase
VIWEDARSIISGNDSPTSTSTIDQPYRGCEHGCIYCYARPTHSYLNLSPGLDFETKIIAKRNIASCCATNSRARLRAELIAIGTGDRLLPAAGARDCAHPLGDRADARRPATRSRW